MDDADVPHLKKLFIWDTFFNTNSVLIYTLVYLRFTASYSIFATITLVLVNLINLLIKNEIKKMLLKNGLIKQ